MHGVGSSGAIVAVVLVLVMATGDRVSAVARAGERARATHADSVAHVLRASIRG
jgi:hypothetical protein